MKSTNLLDASSSPSRAYGPYLSGLPYSINEKELHYCYSSCAVNTSRWIFFPPAGGSAASVAVTLAEG